VIVTVTVTDRAINTVTAIVIVTVTAYDRHIERSLVLVFIYLHREGGKGGVLCYVRSVTHTLSPETVQDSTGRAGQGSTE
jgi:hypothetical protein